MSKFENVSVIKKANVYFDGKVSSRTVLLGSGEAKTLGFMQPGEFVFDTNQKECMELLAGQWDILLPGESEWKTFNAGESFNVDANVSFKVKVSGFADYCCSYTD
ncbi:MAG: pyrimidine/purine nucleoside phosphorylase [Pseudoalteromonas nigrifaciens]|uniref:pyrimidine/purine nucleoside phosphorylase n=1 Tax=Pseudoalteromonas nigrifaciens TaxID=28109 RepID=UPI003F994EF4